MTLDQVEPSDDAVRIPQNIIVELTKLQTETGIYAKRVDDLAASCVTCRAGVYQRIDNDKIYLTERFEDGIKTLSDKLDVMNNRLPLWATTLFGILLLVTGWMANAANVVP